MQKISKKLVEVMKDCSHVAKNGTNDFHHYDYATAADVLQMVNDSLTKHGISSVVSTSLADFHDVTTAKGNIEHLATVEIAVTLTDSDSGESIIMKSLGSGQDAGDKAIAKAQTMAIKYAYLTSFAIATGDAPEADSHTDEVMANNKNSSPNNFKTADKLLCNDCCKSISQKVADYSKAKFGKFLCMDCQKLQKSVA